MITKELIQMIREAIKSRRSRVYHEYYASSDIRLHLLEDIDMILKDVLEAWDK